MNNIQDNNEKVTRVGPLILRKGYSKVTIKGNNRNRVVAKTKTAKYPKDRIISFLKVNATSEEAVYRFCGDYLFLPQELGSNLIKSFAKEQKELKEIFDKTKSDQLTYKDIDTINRKLAFIHPSLSTKKPLFGEPKGVVPLKDIYKTTTHTNLAVSLWEDLSTIIIGESLIRTCPNCGNLFVKSKATQKYCSRTCTNTSTKKRSYKRKHSHTQ